MLNKPHNRPIHIEQDTIHNWIWSEWGRGCIGIYIYLYIYCISVINLADSLQWEYYDGNWNCLFCFALC